MMAGLCEHPKRETYTQIFLLCTLFSHLSTAVGIYTKNFSHIHIYGEETRIETA